jgi:hypothetical protein
VYEALSAAEKNVFLRKFTGSTTQEIVSYLRSLDLCKTYSSLLEDYECKRERAEGRSVSI